MPNSTVSEEIKNYHHPNNVSEQIIFLKIDPKHQPDNVEKILLDACLATPKIMLDKNPSSRLNRIDDWYAEYKVVYKIEHYKDRYKIKQQLWKNIWQHMDYADLQFAKHPMQQTTASEASKIPLNLNELTTGNTKHPTIKCPLGKSTN